MPTYTENPELTLEDLLPLYQAVDWTGYTRNPERLLLAVQHSSWVYTAWEGIQLAGLLRVISDGHTICYVQDILVHPDHQRKGIGKQLLQAALDRYGHLRQFVLITGDEPQQLAFYTTMGLTNGKDNGTNVFVKYNQAGG